MEFVKASLLSLLTTSNETENIILAYRKELYDVAPPNLHWYFKKGLNGQATHLWREKKLKQWLVIGSDDEIGVLWEKLIDKGALHYQWNDVKVDFLLPSVEKVRPDDENYVVIKGIRSFGGDHSSEEYRCDAWHMDTSFLLDEKNNCAFIEGYKKHKEIIPLYPLGLLAENSLTKYMESGTCAVFKKRELFWTLKGDRKGSRNSDPNFFSGFIQASPDFRDNHKVCIRNLTGERILGISDINSTTGRWSVELPVPAGSGQFLIQSSATHEFEFGEKFYLIKDISINSEIVHTVLKDLFGRQINIAEKKAPILINDSLMWIGSSAPDDIQSQIELSDKLMSVLMSLGEKIIINDPYFLGDFVLENGGEIKMTVSQKVFLNALVTSLARSNIHELTVIGYWKRAKNFITGDKSQLESKYNNLYRLIRQIFGTSQALKLLKVDIVLSQEPFHDRYWLGEGVAYHVSNSVNGMFESNELTISKVDDTGKIKLVSRIDSRLRSGERISLI